MELRPTTLLVASILALASTIACAAPATGASLAWPGHRACGTFQARYRIHVFARHVSCHKAVRVEKEYWLAPESEKELVGPDSYNGYVRLKRFPGWRCTSGAMAGGCRKGRKEASYSTYNPRAALSAAGRSHPLDSARPQRAAASRKRGALRLSPTGLEPVHFGMDAAAAERALGEGISVEDGINDCSFWTMPGVRAGSQLIALHGRLSYILLFRRGIGTTRGVRVGDGINRLRHRYRGKLHRGRTASLGYAEQRLFVTERDGGATYEIEFDIVHGRVAFISAATKHVIEAFGECA